MKLFDEYIVELMDAKWLAPELLPVVHDDLEQMVHERIRVRFADVLTPEQAQDLEDAAVYGDYEVILDSLMSAYPELTNDILDQIMIEYTS